MKLRKHTNDIANITYEEEAMSKQAKTLTADELRRVLDYTATRKHSARNRALVLTSFYSGCRVGEISSLLFSDVVDAEGNVRNELVLRAENTKTKEARTVFVSAKLKKELQSYICSYKPTNPYAKLFYSQKFTENELLLASDVVIKSSTYRYKYYMIEILFTDESMHIKTKINEYFQCTDPILKIYYIRQIDKMIIDFIEDQ